MSFYADFVLSGQLGAVGLGSTLEEVIASTGGQVPQLHRDLWFLTHGVAELWFGKSDRTCRQIALQTYKLSQPWGTTPWLGSAQGELPARMPAENLLAELEGKGAFIQENPTFSGSTRSHSFSGVSMTTTITSVTSKDEAAEVGLLPGDIYALHALLDITPKELAEREQYQKNQNIRWREQWGALLGVPVEKIPITAGRPSTASVERVKRTRPRWYQEAVG